MSSIKMRDLKNNMGAFWAFHNSSVENARNSFLFLIFMFYILIIVVSTSDSQILLPYSTVKLPLLSVNLPLIEFYLFVPFLVVMMHFNLLFNWIQHSRKSHVYQEIEQDKNNSTVYPFILNFIISKSSSQLRPFLKILIWILIYLFPLTLLFFIQWQFSAYHSFLMTLWHFIVLILDVFLLAFAWHQIFNPHIYLDDEEEDVLEENPKKSPSKFRTIFKQAKLSFWSYFVIILGVYHLTLLSIFKLTDGSSVAHLLPQLNVSGKTLIESPPSDEIIQRFLALGKTKTEAYCEYASGINLSGRDLRYCNFSGTYLVNVNLNNANLRGANFTEANLHGGNLSNADLSNTQFAYTSMHFVVMENNLMSGMAMKNADLSNAQLIDLDLSQYNLSGCTLNGTTLKNVNLNKAQIQNSDINLAYLSNCKLNACKLKNSRLNGTQFKNNCQLLATDLENAELRGAVFHNAKLTASNLAKAKLEGAVFKESQLTGLSLISANLQGTRLENSELKVSCLSEAKLRGFKGENLDLAHNFHNTLDTTQLTNWSAIANSFEEYLHELHSHMFNSRAITVHDKSEITQVIAQAQKRSQENPHDLASLKTQGNFGEYVQKLQKLACQDEFVASALLAQSTGNATLDKKVKTAILNYLQKNCKGIYQKVKK